MGVLINGQWQNGPNDFTRPPAQFRNWITSDGQPGISGTGGFRAESGRYHLYLSYACPWSHRVFIFRELKKLDAYLSMSIVHPHMLARGWEFIPTHPLLRDHINYCRCLYEIYLLADPFYNGQVSVPVLWDKKLHTIVSNESSDIIRMLNTEFNQLTGNTDDYYPQALRADIDTMNKFVDENITNGVYKCGFSTTQKAYEEAFDILFSALDTLDKQLENHTYLVGDTLTEADWRLFSTLIRFDCVYYSHFKCNLRQLADYKHLSRYAGHLYHLPGIARTVNFEHIKQHYYYSQTQINPSRIVPKGPLLNLNNK